jgi:hypothetical protein
MNKSEFCDRVNKESFILPSTKTRTYVQILIKTSINHVTFYWQVGKEEVNVIG